MSGMLYLAGPLDALDYDGTAWYDDFDGVRPADLVGFMPGRAYLGATPGTGNGRYVNAANKGMIQASIGVIANLSGPGRALGTIREIEFAKSHGKLVVVVGDDLSWSLASWDLVVAPDLETAIKKFV